MKFGKRLPFLVVVFDWASFYVKYKDLKHLISLSVSGHSACISQFRTLFQSEILRVDKEYRKLWNFDSIKAITIVRKALDYTSSSAPTPSTVKCLLTDVTSVRDRLLELQDFSTTNSEGFRKLHKKLLKKTGTEVKSEWDLLLTQTLVWKDNALAKLQPLLDSLSTTISSLQTLQQRLISEHSAYCSIPSLPESALIDLGPENHKPWQPMDVSTDITDKLLLSLRVQDATRVAGLMSSGAISPSLMSRHGAAILHTLYAANEFMAVQQVLAAGVPIDAPNAAGMTVLHMCAVHGNHDGLLHALKQGASLTAQTYSAATAVHLATINGRVSSLVELLCHAVLRVCAVDGDELRTELGCGTSSQSLRDASGPSPLPSWELPTRGREALLAQLVHMDSKSNNPVLLACAHNHPKCLRTLLNAALLATGVGNLDISPALSASTPQIEQPPALALGESADSQSGTPSLLLPSPNPAIQECCKALSATPNLLSHYVDGRCMWTALHTAASIGSFACARVLVRSAGSQLVNERVGLAGNSALHEAASRGYLRCVRILLYAGASQLLQDAHGRSALHAAAKNEHPTTLTVLLASAPKWVLQACPAEPSTAGGYADLRADLVDLTSPAALPSSHAQPESQPLMMHPGMAAHTTTTSVTRGWWPSILRVAVDTSSRACVRVLLAAGADPRAADSSGWSALARALYHADHELASLCREASPGPAADMTFEATKRPVRNRAVLAADAHSSPMPQLAPCPDVDPELAQLLMRDWQLCVSLGGLPTVAGTQARPAIVLYHCFDLAQQLEQRRVRVQVQLVRGRGPALWQWGQRNSGPRAADYSPSATDLHEVQLPLMPRTLRAGRTGLSAAAVAAAVLAACPPSKPHRAMSLHDFPDLPSAGQSSADEASDSETASVSSSDDLAVAPVAQPGETLVVGRGGKLVSRRRASSGLTAHQLPRKPRSARPKPSPAAEPGNALGQRYATGQEGPSRDVVESIDFWESPRPGESFDGDIDQDIRFSARHALEASLVVSVISPAGEVLGRAYAPSSMLTRVHQVGMPITDEKGRQVDVDNLISRLRAQGRSRDLEQAATPKQWEVPSESTTACAGHEQDGYGIHQWQQGGGARLSGQMELPLLDDAQRLVGVLNLRYLFVKPWRPSGAANTALVQQVRSIRAAHARAVPSRDSRTDSRDESIHSAPSTSGAPTTTMDSTSSPAEPLLNFSANSTAPLIVGHRGSGAESSAGVVVDAIGRRTRRTHLSENTILSFVSAANAGAALVEFDVQLSADGVCVLHHDWTIQLPSGVKMPVSHLTWQQLSRLPHSGADEPGIEDARAGSTEGRHSSSVTRTLQALGVDTARRAGKPKAHYGLQDSFTTLERAFKDVPLELAYNLELKYPTSQEALESGARPVDRNAYVDAVLDCVASFAGGRKLVFSTFDPDVALLVSLKQRVYPVFLLTEGGKAFYADPRRNSLRAAVRFAVSAKLTGVVCESAPLIEAPRLIHAVRDAGLALFSYGRSNNSVDNVQLQIKHGVAAIILDHVAHVTRSLGMPAARG